MEGIAALPALPAAAVPGFAVAPFLRHASGQRGSIGKQPNEGFRVRRADSLAVVGKQHGFGVPGNQGPVPGLPVKLQVVGAKGMAHGVLIPASPQFRHGADVVELPLPAHRRQGSAVGLCRVQPYAELRRVRDNAAEPGLGLRRVYVHGVSLHVRPSEAAGLRWPDAAEESERGPSKQGRAFPLARSPRARWPRPA